MSCGKSDFRAQPAVRSIFVYRNGDAHAEARRVLVQDRRVRDFETLLREVTGRVRAPFGAVRCIYTPRAGHRVDAIEHVRHGEKYVAAGKEKFKKLDYLQIGSRKKRTVQGNGLVKAVPQNRMVVSARYLKPIKEPYAIFVVANGDLLNPAVRVLVHNRLLNQYERILEMITEKMGLRILGGVRSLYLLEGVPVTDGKELENGQFYVAVGRDKFKQLPYADSLFSKAVGIRRSVRSKAASLPPIDKYVRQNGEAVNGGSKWNPGDEMRSIERTACLVQQISQARLLALRKKRSNPSNSNSTQENDEAEPQGDAAESKEKPVEDEQVYSSEAAAEEDEEAAAEEDEEAAAEEDEEAAAEEDEEAAAGEDNIAAELEVAATGEEEEEAAAEEEGVAAEEGEATTGEEYEAAAKEEEAASEQEAPAEEKEEAAEEEAAGEEEEAAGEEEEAAGEEEEAAGEEEEAAGEEEEAAGEEEEAAGEEEEAAGEEEEAAGEEEEAAGEEEEAAGEEEEAAGEEEEAAGEEEEAAGEEEEAAGEEEAGETENGEEAGDDAAAGEES